MAQPGVAVLTVEQPLAAELQRLCALAAVPLHVVSATAELRRWWRSARLVLVDAALATAVADADQPRRAGVLVVSDGAVGDEVWPAALRLGAEQVVELPAGRRFLLDRLVSGPDDERLRAMTVGVVPGSGGAGASVLAAGLALAGAGSGRRTTLVDADPLGGGVDLLLGAEGRAGLRWPDLADAAGRVDGAAVTAALPEVGRLAVLSWDRSGPESLTAEAMDAVLSALQRHSDLVVVDLPRRLDAAAGIAAAACDAVLVVVTGDVRATAAAARVTAGLASACPDVRVAVRATAHGGLSPVEVARALGLASTVTVPTAAAVAAAARSGQLGRVLHRGPFAAAVLRLLAETTAQSLPVAG